MAPPHGGKQRSTFGLPLLGRTNKVLCCGFSWRLLVVGWSDVFQIPQQQAKAIQIIKLIIEKRKAVNTLGNMPATGLSEEQMQVG